MTFRCLECGHIFEDGEQAVWEEKHGLETGPYEQFSGCPICKGEYEETKPCAHCGSEKLGNELYEGWCDECLREQITYSTFFDYCEANNDEHYLEIFVMREILNCEYPSNFSSREFHQLMARTYWGRVSEINREKKVFGKTSREIIGSCIRFIMEEDGTIGKENFANFLNEMGKS